MKREDVLARILEIGIVPVIRASSTGEARLAAEAVWRGGIPIVEITMTVPGALEVIAELVKTTPEVLVGAGTVLDQEAARRCADAGAQFLVTPGFDAPTVEVARKRDLLIMAGALTPTEVMVAWKSGADFVKVFPCGNLGGPAYIRALKGPLPQVPLVPTGGVSLENAGDYIRAGAAALGVGGEMILKEALRAQKAEPILEMATKFGKAVHQARNQKSAGT